VRPTPTASPGPRTGRPEPVNRPSTEDQQQLLERYHRTRDPNLREQLVDRYLPLARHLAIRYRHTSEPLDDLVQVASIGLIKALDRFDPAQRTSFSSYAVPTILGELKRHFRDHSWSLHVPRGVKERIQQVNSAMTALSLELGRSPSPRELADRLESTPERVLEALEAGHAYDAVSLDAPRAGQDGEGASLGEHLGGEDSRLELADELSDVSSAVNDLAPRERLILRLRFEEDMTQAEIAQVVGLSQMQISRLLRRSLEQVRARMDADAGVLAAL
jgi:RNA polymerase sigma-B factor